MARLDHLKSLLEDVWRETRDRIEGDSQWNLDHWCKANLPSGSGFDAGTRLLYDSCRFNRKGQCTKIVLETDYHGMDDNGYYAGWLNNIRITFDLTQSQPWPCVRGNFHRYCRATGVYINSDFVADTFNWRLNECS